MHTKELFDLSGRVAIVTGGGSGLGRQMATALAEMGADVLLCARNAERCVETAAELGCRVTARWTTRYRPTKTITMIPSRGQVVVRVVTGSGISAGARRSPIRRYSSRRVLPDAASSAAASATGTSLAELAAPKLRAAGTPSAQAR